MLGDKHWWVGNVLLAMGEMYHKDMGGAEHADEAIKCFSEAADIFNANGKRDKVIKCLGYLVEAYRAAGREAEAERADLQLQAKKL